jgi:phage tail sheath protein FI
MKYTLLLPVALLYLNTHAQQVKTILRDSLQAKAVIKNYAPNRKTVSGLPIEATIENELNKIVAAYTNQPNTAATWIQIKAAAENILYTHFLNGKLLGTKKEQAFYVKMGTETMSAADIAARKMILIAGIATVKPAEFVLIRVEKSCTK